MSKKDETEKNNEPSYDKEEPKLQEELKNHAVAEARLQAQNAAWAAQEPILEQELMKAQDNAITGARNDVVNAAWAESQPRIDAELIQAKDIALENALVAAENAVWVAQEPILKIKLTQAQDDAVANARLQAVNAAWTDYQGTLGQQLDSNSLKALEEDIKQTAGAQFDSDLVSIETIKTNSSTTFLAIDGNSEASVKRAARLQFMEDETWVNGVYQNAELEFFASPNNTEDGVKQNAGAQFDKNLALIESIKSAAYDEFIASPNNTEDGVKKAAGAQFDNNSALIDSIKSAAHKDFFASPNNTEDDADKQDDPVITTAADDKEEEAATGNCPQSQLKYQAYSALPGGVNKVLPDFNDLETTGTIPCSNSDDEMKFLKMTYSELKTLLQKAKEYDALKKEYDALKKENNESDTAAGDAGAGDAGAGDAGAGDAGAGDAAAGDAGAGDAGAGDAAAGSTTNGSTIIQKITFLGTKGKFGGKEDYVGTLKTFSEQAYGKAIGIFDTTSGTGAYVTGCTVTSVASDGPYFGAIDVTFTTSVSSAQSIAATTASKALTTTGYATAATAVQTANNAAYSEVTVPTATAVVVFSITTSGSSSGSAPADPDMDFIITEEYNPNLTLVPWFDTNMGSGWTAVSENQQNEEVKVYFYDEGNNLSDRDGKRAKNNQQPKVPPQNLPEHVKGGEGNGGVNPPSRVQLEDGSWVAGEAPPLLDVAQFLKKAIEIKFKKETEGEHSFEFQFVRTDFRPLTSERDELDIAIIAEMLTEEGDWEGLPEMINLEQSTGESFSIALSKGTYRFIVYNAYTSPDTKWNLEIGDAATFNLIWRKNPQGGESGYSFKKSSGSTSGSSPPQGYGIEIPTVEVNIQDDVDVDDGTLEEAIKEEYAETAGVDPSKVTVEKVEA